MEHCGLSFVWTFSEIENTYKNCVAKYPLLPKSFKSEQVKALQAILNGNDVLLLLPTSYGKSLVFLTPGLFAVETKGCSSFTIIVSPLISLISDGMNYLNEVGLRSYNHTMNSPDDNLKQFIQNEEVGAKYIFVSPEVLRNKFIKKVLWELSPCYLAVDEGHVVSEWGKDFRTDYGRLYEIRAGLNCPMGVFTATLTPQIVNDVVLKTGLNKLNLVVIAVEPDRKNIFLELREPTRNMKSLNFLREEIKSSRCKFPKTIIFVTTLQETVDIFLWFEDYLREDMCYSVAGIPLGYLVNYYTGSTEPEAKESILKQFKDENGFLRLLICTVAFGMGVNIPDIRRVIIWGMPQSAMQLWQEIGRAGRDQMPSTAIIFPFKTRIVDSNVPFRIPCNVCVRKFILDAFVQPENAAVGPEVKNLNSCCSVCSEEEKYHVSQPETSPTKKKSFLSFCQK